MVHTRGLALLGVDGVAGTSVRSATNGWVGTLLRVEVGVAATALSSTSVGLKVADREGSSVGVAVGTCVSVGCG